MSLRDILQDDWKQALKSGNKIEASTISMVKAAILIKDKLDGKKVEDDLEIIQIISKEVKQRKESVLEFEKGNRHDLVDSANEEIKVLMKYLPTQLSESEIKELIKTTAIEIGASTIKDMGKLKQAITPLTAGKADAKLVSKIAREYLEKE